MTGNGSGSDGTKPRTRRTTRRIRRTPSDDTPETQEAVAEAPADEDVAEAPRRRTRTRRVRPDAAEEAVEASSAEPRIEAPRPSRSRSRAEARSDAPSESAEDYISRRWNEEDAGELVDPPARRASRSGDARDERVAGERPEAARSERESESADRPARREALDTEWFDREPWDEVPAAREGEPAGEVHFAEAAEGEGRPEGEGYGGRRGRRGGRRRRGRGENPPANGQGPMPRRDAGRPFDQGGAPPGGMEGDYAPGRRRRRRRRRGGGAGQGQQGYQGQQFQGRQGQQYRDQRGRGQQPYRDRRPMGPDDVGGEVTGTTEGVLELHDKGFGFLRDPKRNYIAQDSDPFVSGSFIEKHSLREGILIKGDVGPGTRGQGPRLKSIESIDGRTVEEYARIRPFDDLTPINPYEQIKLETGPRPVTMRVMDLLTPIGKGQRALIVAPPRSGKTMLLQDIADSVSANHPELHLMVVLIDERPEEVTEMRRRVRGEVIASSMDRDVESHIRVSKLIFERARRLAEAGGEVFILLDSVTRLARAFNKGINTGRTGTGGLDVRALDIPRKIFGTARRFDEGGSLTVVATALIDTGSRMDDAIFQEFKGTGNMELVLSRDLADRRIWPAMDISLSGTRREEKILSKEVLDGVTLLRRSLVSMNSVEAMEQLIKTLERFPTNAEFLARVRNIL